MIKFRALLSSVVVSGIIATLNLVPVYGASSPTNGISISPAVNNIHLQPNQSSDTISESITNLTNNLLAIDVTAKDFGALNTNGSIGFFGSNYNSSKNTHSLASSVSIPLDEFLVQPYSSTTIQISINNVSLLAPGGHYCAILFTPLIARSTSGSNQISVQPSVAALVFLTTTNGGYKSLKLSGLSFPSFGLNIPSTAYVNLTNNGNTQIVPRGFISLKDPFSHTITQAIINPDSYIILPGASRVFMVNLPSVSSIFRLAGVYRLKLNYRYDGNLNYSTGTKSYFFFNPVYIVYLAVLALIIANRKKILNRLPSLRDLKRAVSKLWKSIKKFCQKISKKVASKR